LFLLFENKLTNGRKETWKTIYPSRIKLETNFLNLMQQLMKHCRFFKSTNIQAIWALAGQKKGKFCIILSVFLFRKVVS